MNAPRNLLPSQSACSDSRRRSRQENCQSATGVASYRLEFPDALTLHLLSRQVVDLQLADAGRTAVAFFDHQLQ